jgi:chromosome segregation ATPase
VQAKKKAGAAGRKAGQGSGAASATASRELAALKREKNTLEKQLTETVREIGQLRHHEARAAQFERQLKERDETIARLRSQLHERREREYTPPDDEVQPSLALGSRAPRDLDDLDDDIVPDDEDDELI